jgi:hypothetical protein
MISISREMANSGGGRKWWPIWMRGRYRWFCKGCRVKIPCWPTGQMQEATTLQVAGSRTVRVTTSNGRLQGIVSAQVKQAWDFVLVRNDGSQVFLHPNWKGGKITCFLVDAASCTPPPDPELPRSGQTGPFWYFKDKAATHTLRFDIRKTPTAKAKAKATVHPPQAKAKAEGSA